ncbi:MAG TPA: Gfo/Idh/MocA family oxidoreductase [Atribacterota bacterium]|nr:Gfo/Idh/MocA family oxidoreductase [Atribacterota bacterium]
MNEIGIGVIGIGFMGSYYAKALKDGVIPRAKLIAVCDKGIKRLKWAEGNLGKNIKRYDNYDDILNDKDLSAVIIAVPHYDHPSLAMKAFGKNLHVLIDKPAGVYTKKVREMNEAASKSNKVFGIMYQFRTKPIYQKLRDLIKSGELGEIKRTNWIITDWYRSQSYYDSGTWRATWEGEGGGTLLNQNPHNLDIWQWTCGMPKRIRAFCYFGKYHDIEVEDDVTAFVEYKNGSTGVYVTSTADSPGTNRFEISGDRGKIVVENEELSFWRLRQSERLFNKEYKDGGFGAPECWKCEIPIQKKDTEERVEIINNWIDAILDGTDLLSPGEEGINGLMISNAMLLSTWINDWVDLPIDEDLFYEELKSKISNSKLNK